MDNSHFFYGLLINLLVILIIILLVNFHTLSKQGTTKLPFHPFHIFITCAILIFFSLTLSIKLDNGFVYDLRYIPFLLGGVYGGKRVLLGLAGALILIRFPLLGPGFIVTVFLTILSCFVILYVAPKLSSKPWTTRVYWFSFFSFCYSILAFLIPSLFYGFHDFTSFFIYSGTLTGSTFFVFYLYEMIRTTYILQLESIKYEKMHVVSQLAASMSHEVRNPLTTVKGFLQLIHESPMDTQTNQDLSKVAVNEINRATDIINQYLTFAKPHPEVEMELDVTEEITRSTEIVMPLALNHGVLIEVDLLHKHSITGEPNKFQQVLINILKNGIEAMESGGILTITSFEEDQNLFIVIKDSGIGMTEEQVTRLGEPYFSLKGKNGTGLGMMTVFKLVHVMKGTIDVWSKLNEGTTITLSFPITEQSSMKV
ncbi:HAMP domain-containing sensor histidine kinase [Bacillus sp. Marseille-Q3570]|uniref:sensor histidine kinase n=1 Tax=Bacillus sp. Marseille-Q3570 TaxID=2963522 RepID=UPI0021B6F18B|nr:HAMP domain-containing sensor histidine kinase [Bacillus sp. Marseille-Q3570]